MSLFIVYKYTGCIYMTTCLDSDQVHRMSVMTHYSLLYICFVRLVYAATMTPSPLQHGVEISIPLLLDLMHTILTFYCSGFHRWFIWISIYINCVIYSIVYLCGSLTQFVNRILITIRYCIVFA